MRFRLNEKKAAQAAAYLLRKRSGSRKFGDLVKLLYLADRQKLMARGTPITGDKLVSMPHGTALSVILNLARRKQPSRVWADYVSAPVKQEIHSLRDDTDELSEYELRILDDIDQRFGHMTFWQLRTYTHRLPEYEDPHGSSKPIKPETILRAAGRSPDEIAAAAEDAEAVWSIDSLDH